MRASTFTPSGQSQKTVNSKKKKKRVRAFTADDRATHRVIEKQRRETLNQCFVDLARLLPGLAHTRRLSKSVIVNESISYLKAQREIRLAAAKEVRELLADYDNLLSESKGWQTLQTPTIVGKQHTKPEKKALLELLKVEKEEFGTFSGGFGDNGPGNDDRGEESDTRFHDMENSTNYFEREESEENDVHEHQRLTGDVDVLHPLIESAEMTTNLFPQDDPYTFPQLQQTPRQLESSLDEQTTHPLGICLDEELNSGWANEIWNQFTSFGARNPPATGVTGFSTFSPNQNLYSIGASPQDFRNDASFMQYPDHPLSPFEVQQQEKIGFSRPQW